MSEPVHYSTEADVARGMPRALVYGSQITVWGVLSAALTAFLLGALVVQLAFSRLGHQAGLITVAMLGVAALGIAIRLLGPLVRRAYGESMELQPLPMREDYTRRVRCVGSTGAIRRLGPIPTDPFEPVIVRLLFAGRRHRAYVPVAILGGLLSLALVLSAAALTGSPARIMQLPIWSLTSFIMAFAAFGGCVFAAAVFPTYLRIAPGRVDVLRFSWLGRGRPEVRTHDVRSRPLAVYLRFGAALIGPPWIPDAVPRGREGEDQPDAIVFAGSFDRTRIARALLAAAISPHPTPPLPEDALVG